jgi:cell division protein FtsA
VAKQNDQMIVGIDIGSSTLRALGSIMREESRYPLVIASYTKSLDGIDKGNIVDTDEIANAIENAIESLESSTGYRAVSTLISLSAYGLSSHHGSGYAQVSRGDAAITDIDIENAIKDGHRGVTDIRNKSIIHSIPIDYKVDGNKIQGDIVGVRGNRLEAKTLYVTYPLQCMNVLKKTLDKANVSVTDIIAGPIAESIPLLTKKQKVSGVALVNLGKTVTSILVYEKNVPLLISTIPIGGDDIIRDVALGMKITLDEAEAVVLGRSTTAYSKRKIEEIIEARLEDLCKKINKELSRIGREELLPAGVIITGSSSYVPRIEYVFRNELKLPIKLITDEMSRITNDVVKEGHWARVYGLTFLAPTDTEKDVFKDLITSLFLRVKKFISQFLP